MSVSYRPKGEAFTRAVIARALADGVPDDAVQIAADRWGTQSPFYTRAAVPAGATVSGNWGEDLVPSDAATAEFLALVAERTVLGRMSGRRRVPANTRMLEQSTGLASGWVPDGKPIPVSAASFNNWSLPPLKVAASTVITTELLRDSRPEAEMLIRNDLARVLVEAIDASLLDSTNSGTAGEEPASITSGITPVSPTSDPAADMASLIGDFAGDLTRAYFIASPSYAAALSGADYPNVGARGGELLGIPVLTSRKAPADALILADPGGIAVVEGELEIKVTRQGAIQLLDNPTNSTTGPTATNMVSLWQAGGVAVAAMRWMNWQAQAGAVSMLAS